MKELFSVITLYVFLWFGFLLLIPNSIYGLLGFPLKVELLIFYLPILFIIYLVTRLWRNN